MYVNVKKKKWKTLLNTLCVALVSRIYIYPERRRTHAGYIHTHTVYTINTRTTLNEYTMMIPW